MSSNLSLLSTSSSYVFCWNISLQEWNKVEEDRFLSLPLACVAPRDGIMSQFKLDVFPKGFHVRNGIRTIAAKLEDIHPEHKLEQIQIETAYRIRHNNCDWPMDMYSLRSYLSFHSDVYKEYDFQWLGESYKVGTVEDRALDGFISFEFEIRTFSAPRMMSKFSGSKEEIVKGFLAVNPADGDVKLVCDAKEFACHKFLLISQSPVFRAMFQMDSKEKEQNVVDIEDSTPEAVEEFVFYLYKGSLRRFYNYKSVEQMFGLLHLANKYQMNLLMNECMDVIMDMLDVDNVLKIFAVVGKIDHLPRHISDSIIAFMKKNIEVIVDKVDWSAFTSDHPSLVKDFILNMNQELKGSEDNNDM